MWKYVLTIHIHFIHIIPLDTKRRNLTVDQRPPQLKTKRYKCYAQCVVWHCVTDTSCGFISFRSLKSKEFLFVRFGQNKSDESNFIRICFNENEKGQPSLKSILWQIVRISGNVLSKHTKWCILPLWTKNLSRGSLKSSFCLSLYILCLFFLCVFFRSVMFESLVTCCLFERLAFIFEFLLSFQE